MNGRKLLLITAGRCCCSEMDSRGYGGLTERLRLAIGSWDLQLLASLPAKKDTTACGITGGNRQPRQLSVGARLCREESEVTGNFKEEGDEERLMKRIRDENFPIARHSLEKSIIKG
ncbi:DNA repair protein RecO [Striga asiatica]|uniref:DNA repair protein RecO n=1 Tax=Striga asiatica TaxID=4170 RepID=A0A5A7QTB7_STRAF|nr:DNA repair protein RecO [Striga asiatica]